MFDVINYKKEKTMKKVLSILLSTIVLCLTGCSAKTPERTAELPQAAYLIDDAIIDEVCTTLENSGLKNTDVYKEWAKDFSDTSAKKTELPKNWLKLGDLKGDLYSCADYWEKSHNYSDANCRMTAMLLMGDLLRVDKPEKEYNGTYLMMDVDAIDNAERYSILKERKANFTTLFGEIPIPQSGLSEALPQNWKKHSISFTSENVSLISVVIEDTMSKTAFVGHAGLLIDEGSHLLFVEKLAFEQPYQATKFNNADELVKMLSSRPEYAAEDGKEPSVICRNDKVIGKIINN